MDGSVRAPTTIITTTQQKIKYRKPGGEVCALLRCVILELDFFFPVAFTHLI